MHIRRDYSLVPLLLSVHKQTATEVCRQGFYYRWKTLAILGFVRSKFPANFCQCVQGGKTEIEVKMMEDFHGRMCEKKVS
jgi:hypothetical protein